MLLGKEQKLENLIVREYSKAEQWERIIREAAAQEKGVLWLSGIRRLVETEKWLIAIKSAYIVKSANVNKKLNLELFKEIIRKRGTKP